MVNERTTEKTLSYIGLGFHIVWCILIILSTALLVSFFTAIFSGGSSVESSFNVLVSSVLWASAGFSLLSLGFIIRAVVIVETKSKEAAIILLVNGSVLLLVTMGAAIVQSVLFIIAGIMLIKKERAEEEEEVDSV
ncbi:hypothetical protein [Bacillus sp. JCM 19041]|uniref:hypothetical protein n=1 Tax=Bacillus sp. JCM 19041 TaxID=1460637 RepID=UPI0006D1A48E